MTVNWKRSICWRYVFKHEHMLLTNTLWPKLYFSPLWKYIAAKSENFGFTTPNNVVAHIKLPSGATNRRVHRRAWSSRHNSELLSKLSHHPATQQSSFLARRQTDADAKTTVTKASSIQRPSLVLVYCDFQSVSSHTVTLRTLLHPSLLSPTFIHLLQAAVHRHDPIQLECRLATGNIGYTDPIFSRVRSGMLVWCTVAFTLPHRLTSQQHAVGNKVAINIFIRQTNTAGSINNVNNAWKKNKK